MPWNSALPSQINDIGRRMEVSELVNTILSKRLEVTPSRAMLVGISGVDACGKGYITAKLAEALAKEVKVAVINVDGWLNLPDVRFGDTDPGGHFYHHALRLDEMFEQLIIPLRDRLSIDLEANHAEETASEYRRHLYYFENIDIIILEGIFLFKREYIKHFDLKVWVECPFEKALERAVERSQEGLTPDETTKAYQTTYFPAQILHLKTDDPKDAADITFDNN